MARVLRPGGTVAAYAWDMLGGGFPMAPILSEVRPLGKETVGPPRAEASRMEALRELWVNAGLEGVETRKITVQRTFTNFDDFWASSTATGSVRLTVDALSRDEAETVRTRLRAKLPAGRSHHLQSFCQRHKGPRAELIRKADVTPMP
jgi:hypothetical protein